ncbi:hypothetical protein Vafri_10000 [Volvox africanus]|uniref:Pherophorin domain-containing protein n=1 Tax=Volvox africanus TaxID=51714 RepID=A0A8J4EZF4_9CHLO|nr:hypothetical protein Vafri_10000 [Volvox africanus]
MNRVQKLHLIINAECIPDSSRRSNDLAAATVNDISFDVHLSTIDLRDMPYGLLTIRRIDNVIKTIPSGGLYVCLSLNRASKCDRPSTLCSGPTCVYQLSDDRGCCPTSEVPD